MQIYIEEEGFIRQTEDRHFQKASTSIIWILLTFLAYTSYECSRFFAILTIKSEKSWLKSCRESNICLTHKINLSIDKYWNDNYIRYYYNLK